MFRNYLPIPRVLSYYTPSDNDTDPKNYAKQDEDPVRANNFHANTNNKSLYACNYSRIEAFGVDLNDLYLMSNQIWHPTIANDMFEKVEKFVPHIEAEENSCENPYQLLRQSTESNRPSNIQDGFVNYCQIPTIYSKSKFPLIVYSTAEAIRNRVFIFGGLVNKPSGSSDFINIKVPMTEYPPPLEDWIINNPYLKPNMELLVLDSDTSIVQSAVIFGDVPPPLCCASMTKITNRYLFIYGGFEVKTETLDLQNANADSSDSIPDKYYSRTLELSDRCWVLDSYTYKFTEIKLTAHPTAGYLHPVTIARFGHSATCHSSQNISSTETFRKLYYDGITENEHRQKDQDSYTRPDENKSLENNDKSFVSIFVFGGFKFEPKEDKYIALNDLWKIELIISDEGPQNYLLFSKEALASPLSSLDEGPTGRAFHAAIICDDEKFVNKFAVPSFSNGARGISLGKTSSPSKPEGSPSGFKSGTTTSFETNKSSAASNLSDHEKQKVGNMSLLVHGGSGGGNTVLSDFWRYSFNRNEWEKMSTFSKLFDQNSLMANGTIGVQHTRTNHNMVLLGQYLIFTGGISQTDVDKLRRPSALQTEGSDLSKDFMRLDLKDQNSTENDFDTEILSVVSYLNTRMLNMNYNNLQMETKAETLSKQLPRLLVLDLHTMTWLFNRYDYQTISSSWFDQQLGSTDKVKRFQFLLQDGKGVKYDSPVFHTAVNQLLKEEMPGKVSSSKYTPDFLLKSAILIKRINEVYSGGNNGSIGTATVYCNRSLFKIGGVLALEPEYANASDIGNSILNKGGFNSIMDFELPVHSKDALLTDDLEQEYVLNKLS